MKNLKWYWMKKMQSFPLRIPTATPSSRVKITTRFGDIVIELFDEAPYHKANFIYLTRLGYFNNTFFHRVVPNFVIQEAILTTQTPVKKDV